MEMERKSFKDYASQLVKTAQKHSPEILTGIGIVGMATGTVLAVKSTPKALTLIKEEKEKQNAESLDALTTVKTVWRCYIPATLLELVSIICLIEANVVNSKRNTALAMAYGITEMTLKEYQEKVVETIGEKKEQTVRDNIAKDRMEKDPVDNKRIFITGNGETLCYDEITGRYFKSDIEKIKKVENDLNRIMLNEDYVSLNDFYEEIGLDSVGIGSVLGWNIRNGYLSLCFSSQLASDGTPCLVIGYHNQPYYGFKNER